MFCYFCICDNYSTHLSVREMEQGLLQLNYMQLSEHSSPDRIMGRILSCPGLYCRLPGDFLSRFLDILRLETGQEKKYKGRREAI